MRAFVMALGLLAGVSSGEVRAASDPASSLLGEGSLVVEQKGKIVRFPLKKTEVSIRVAGPLAEASVRQRFENPYSEKIEAVYVFPLPTDAAVRAFELRSGDRHIRGRLLPRGEAAEVYRKAREAGRVAALLEEQRPNLFTQTVANLEPGRTVEVTLRYVQPIRHEAGLHELVFPMVVGPRFVPRTRTARAAASDAAPVTPPVLPPAVRSAHEIALTVELDAGVPLVAVGSTSHRLRVERSSPSRASIGLAKDDRIPNKDFVLRYRVGEALPRAAVLTSSPGGGAGHLMLVLQPPDPRSAAPAVPRELIFVIDTSSSMSGAPLQQAKTLVKHLLERLRPEDTFQLVRFDERALSLGPDLIASKESNRQVALDWLAGMQASGGTWMAAGLGKALALPHDPARLRLVIFLSDGYVGNEREVLALLRKQLGAARIFPFGIGTAVNRYLLEEMAVLGRGEVQVLRPDEPTGPAVSRFYGRIAHPLLTDLRLTTQGVRLSEISPATLPDLFLGQPLYLLARYHGSGAARVVLSGRRAGREVRLEVPFTVPAVAHATGPLELAWARARIAEEERRLLEREDEAIKRRIVELSLRHGLLTRFTSFVAVDEDSFTRGKALRVEVPVERPEGLLRGGSGGGSYGVGGLSLVGSGYGGGGVGHGAAGYSLSAHVAAAPQVRVAHVAIMGALDKEVIRREIRKHMNEVRFCYERELGPAPTLEGRAVLKLTIEDGAVRAATVEQSTLASPAVESCLAAAAKTWGFPAAKGGGLVIVNYPFVFRPGDVHRR